MQFETDQWKISDLLAGHFSKSLTAIYTLDDQGRVCCDGNVGTTTSFAGNHLPFRWGKVDGDFDITGMQLESLEGCPHTVGGEFLCLWNRLRSLQGGPRVVGKEYTATGLHNLTILDGLPEQIVNDEEVAWIYLSYRPDLPLLKLMTVRGLTKVQLNGGEQVAAIINRYLLRGVNGVMPCAAELHKAGYGGNAKL